MRDWEVGLRKLQGFGYGEEEEEEFLERESVVTVWEQKGWKPVYKLQQKSLQSEQNTCTKFLAEK